MRNVKVWQTGLCLKAGWVHPCRPFTHTSCWLSWHWGPAVPGHEYCGRKQRSMEILPSRSTEGLPWDDVFPFEKELFKITGLRIAREKQNHSRHKKTFCFSEKKKKNYAWARAQANLHDIKAIQIRLLTKSKSYRGISLSPLWML